jgi:3-methyladenine DNA glycosylase AlkC
MTKTAINSPGAVPAERRKLLSEGKVESRTLGEGLAVDFVILLNQLQSGLGTAHKAQLSNGTGITQRMSNAAKILHAALKQKSLELCAQHTSDTARGIAAYIVSELPQLELAEQLELIKPFAEDSHFGVREWAWLALRPQLAKDIDRSITLLTPWTSSASAGIRRFASEATRPRGVWCAHIDALKKNPSPGLALLNPLHSDGERYVQDSVANWMNDAAKTQPDWVREQCKRWLKQSNTAATQYICKRAQRSL